MSSDRELSAQRPYLLRAMHEWMSDNGLTPHIVVDEEAQGLRAPAGHAADGKLVLNISYSATRSLTLGNDVISFEARFNGAPFQLSVPVTAVVGIYARETGQGMAFAADDSPPPGPDGGTKLAATQPPVRKSERPSLKVVK
jgi:stringent starvation protein B